MAFACRTRCGRRRFVAAMLVASACPFAALRAETQGAGGLTEFHLAWSWAGFGEDPGLRGLEIVDFDGDGRGEIVGTSEYGYWFVARQGDMVEPVWSSLPVQGQLRALDAQRAGAAALVVVGTTAEIQVWDGARRVQLSAFPLATSELETLAAADLDGDDLLEVIVCDPWDLFLYDLATGDLLAVRYGFGCRDLDVGQLDADPQLEIALAGTAGGFVLDGATLTVDWADIRGFGNRVRMADLDGDGRDEVVSTILAWDGVRAQDPDGGGTLWERTDLELVALAAGEVDPSPGTEILVGRYQYGDDIHVLAGGTGFELWTLDNEFGSVSRIAIGDTGAEPGPEIVWGGGAWSTSYPDLLYVASSATHAVVASSLDLRGPFPGFAVADLDGDGAPELATASWTVDNGYFAGGAFLVFSFDRGELLRWSGQQQPGSFGAAISQFAAGQLDADPALELCAISWSWSVVGCYDGLDFAEQWRLELLAPAFGLAVGEIDGSGLPEVLVGSSEGRVAAFAGESGALQWQSPVLPDPMDLYTRVRVADLEGDGAAEVLAGYSYPNLYHGWLTTFTGLDGELLYGPWQDPPLTSIVVTELDGDAGDEVVLGQADGNVWQVDPATGLLGSFLASFPERVDALARHDVSRDGVPDLVAVTGGFLRVHDGAAGAIVWSSPYLGEGAGYDETLLVGDGDGDGVAELIVNTGHGIAVFESPLIAIFADGFESGDASAWSSVVP